MMLDKEHHKRVVNWTRAKDFRRQSLRKALHITLSGDREIAAIWRLDEGEVGGQIICLQAIPAQMSCNDVLEWAAEEVLKEYERPGPQPRTAAGQLQRTPAIGLAFPLWVTPPGIGPKTDPSPPTHTTSLWGGMQ